MKNVLKNIFKKTFVPITLSVICGAICGRVVFSIYESDNIMAINNSVYLLQAGAYSSYDNMKANTIANNYIYYKDDGLYKAIIGITSSLDNVEKIKKSYNGDIIVSEYYSNDVNLIKEIQKLDEKLSIESDNNKIKEIINSMLSLYKEENIKLIKAN